MDARALDHIALWVADRDTLADFVCAHAGMHVIDRTDAFTLVGSDARRVEVPDTDVEYDIDHVVLRVPDPGRAAESLAALGLQPDGDSRLVVGDKHVLLVPGASETAERPLLNHIALLVDSGQEQIDAARAQGIEIAEIRDAANTFAFFVWGPDQIQLEYVEHKPEFSLT